MQTLVDFSRPVELQLREQDLREVVSSVLMLASADLETRNVHVISSVPDLPLMAKLDADLMKQALLNVVLNGAQAMADGGELEVAVLGRRPHGQHQCAGRRRRNSRGYRDKKFSISTSLPSAKAAESV